MVEQARIHLTRKLGIAFSWAIWLAALCVAYLTHTSQIYIAALFLLGFAPYLLVINVVEPWLSRRAASRSSGGSAG